MRGECAVTFGNGARTTVDEVEIDIRALEDLSFLSRREKEVLRCTIRGRSVKETAEALNIARKTVDNLRVRLMRKLCVHSAVEVVLWAVQRGLLIANKRLGATADPESVDAIGVNGG